MSVKGMMFYWLSEYGSKNGKKGARSFHKKHIRRRVRRINKAAINEND